MTAELGGERFLIVRLAAVGDVVMASTLARRIRDERPGATITWLCGASTAPLVEHLADVDDVLTVDERRVLRGGPLARAAEFATLWSKLLKRRFTQILLLHVDRRYRVITAPLLGTPLVSLTRSTHGAMNPVPGRYLGDEYARLLDGLQHTGPITAHYPLGRLKPLPPMVQAAEYDGAARHVVLVPGGARNVMRESGVRRWPVEHYASVARSLVGDGCHVTIIGDGNDAWVRPSFAGIDVDDRIGATSLPETLALMAESDLVISHDTGPMHLARLARARLVALFGPTMPSQFLVEDSRTTVLWGGAHLLCRPCYDGREFAACRDNVCMSSIEPAIVYGTARTILRAPGMHVASGEILAR
jgi:heptosyltransferase II